MRFFSVLWGLLYFSGLAINTTALRAQTPEVVAEQTNCGSLVLSDLFRQTEPDSGAMTALADCLLKQAAQEDKNTLSLRNSLNSLPNQFPVTTEQVQNISRLLTAGSNPQSRAIGFFAANSMLQVAQSSKLLETPVGRTRAADTFTAINEFVSRYGTSAASSQIAAETQKLSSQISDLAFAAALSARRDMVASVTLRAKTYFLHIKSSKVNLENTVSNDAIESSIHSLEQLFTEINTKTNEALETGAFKNISVSESDWLENFDGRLIAVVRHITPGTDNLESAVNLWHAALKSSHPEAQAENAGGNTDEILLDLAPDQMRSEVYETVQALRKVIPQIRKEITSSSGVVDRSMFGLTSQSLAAIDYLDKTLDGTGIYVRRITEPEELEKAWRARQLIKTLATWTLEASLSKSRTAEGLASVLGKSLNNLKSKDKNFLSPDDLHRIHQLIEDQNSENWVRAFINREMAVVYAHSALLLGEAVSVPFTWGGSAAAMPVTLHAVVVGLQVVGKTTLIVTSTLNISDRYVQQGIKGLINPSSALDALTIVMMLPRPIPGAVDAQTWLGRALQGGRNQVAAWMHEASRFAIAGHAAFGAYQLAFADHIAATLRLQGYQTTTEEVRRQALGHFAEAFLLGIVEWNEYQHGQALGGQYHTQTMASTNPVTIVLNRLRNMVFPHQAAIETFNSLAPIVGTPLAGAASVVPAAGYLAYDYLIGSEALMYFYAGSDFGYFSHIRKNAEYPDLKNNESAVTFIGFDEADMLHAGAHSIDSHKVELEKYGSRYFVYDYKSREDFLHKLTEHARTHGPIKYLRIMTHGLPGKLYTGDVSAAAVDETGDRSEMAQRDGWIDANWLRQNSDKIRKIAKTSIAPEARVVLFACLVGANLDTAAPGLAQNSGDDFLKALGETLLSQGGLIDSSIRFLMGLDTIYGGLMNWSARDEMIQSNRAVKHNPILPISLYQLGQQGFLETNENLKDSMAQALLSAATGEGAVVASEESNNHDWAQSSEMLQFAVARMWRMLTQLHKLGIHYGINLEGPWWSTPRYKHARVIPINDKGSEVKVEITTF